MDVRQVRSLLAITPVLWMSLGACAQPSNDTCASAQPIVVPGLYTAVRTAGSSIGATSDLTHTCGVGDNIDVWYSFTAPVAGIWYFDTLNSLLFDTTLALYSTCGTVELACNDDIDFGNSVFWSAIAMTMSAGQSVKIRVSANGSDSDLLALNIVGLPNTANNSCSTADTIVANQTRSGSTLLATTDVTVLAASCGLHPGSGGGRDVFYAFTPTVTQPYRVTLCGSGFDTVLTVLADCSGNASSVLACNDDSAVCTTTPLASHLVAVPLNAGVRYLIRVAGFDYGPPDVGTYTLLITPLSTGVCCRGATCTVASVTTCMGGTGTAGVVFGPGSDCNAAGVNNTPCCHANYNKVGGISVQDIFDFLSDWFAGSALTAIGTTGTTSPTVQHIFGFLSAWFAGGC